MSVEVSESHAASGSPGSSISLGVPAAGAVALGVSYAGTGSEASASTLLRTVKQGAESEDDSRKRRGRGAGGGKKLRDRSPKFLNANKHLMKKGILELDSRSQNDKIIPSSSSTLPPSLPGSTASRPNEVSRPHSFYAATLPNGLPSGEAPVISEVTTGGVLVAGAGSSMRMLRKQSSDEQQSLALRPVNSGGQLAFSPDSGYGNTPDAMGTPSDRQQLSVLANGGVSTQHQQRQPQHGVGPGGGSGDHTRNRLPSDRTSSSESITVTTTAAQDTPTATLGDTPASFCGGNMSLSQGAKFTIGEPVSTPFLSVNSPPPSHSIPINNIRQDKGNSLLPNSSSLSVVEDGPTTSERSPLSADAARNYSPFSSNYSLSPGPMEQAQQFQFQNGSGTTAPLSGGRGAEMSGVSQSPSLSLSPNHLRRAVSPGGGGTVVPHHGTILEVGESPQDSVSGSDGVDGGQELVGARQITALRERSRKRRSHSQPVVASLGVLQRRRDASPSTTTTATTSTTTASQKDYFQVTDELSRENSHFSLSEAMLTVVEQYKANTTEAVQESVRGEREQVSVTPDYSEVGPPGPPPSEFCSTSPPPRSWGSLSSIATEDSMDGFSLQKHTPKISLLELMQFSGNVHSAESTARRLLQFIASQYSGVETTEDLTSTQNVLTLPVDFLSSLRQDEDLQKSVTTSTQTTRGSKDWAPPRAQIIFHIKPPSRNVLRQVAAQGYRCTGCGMRQEPSQARYFRFCNYTGKYFCQKCHTNATSVIPAYILDRWSFKKYYVSNFAHDLMERIHYEPVFDVHNINPGIYSTVPILAQARDLRSQLVAVKKYLKTCRQAQSLTATFDGYIPWTADVHTYSINDFLQIKLKLRYLRSLLSDSIKHVKSCPLCQGKGFVCEFCGSPEIIFPFELNKVSKCPYCQCCFHKQCFNTQPCPRCIRMRQRERRRRTQCVEEEGENSTETSSGD